MSMSKPIIKKRGKTWQVDYGRKNGSRVRQSFKTKAEAEADVTAKRIEQKNNSVALTGLPDGQRMDVLRAMKKLDGRGSLEQAVDFYLQHCAPAGARTIEECLTEYVEAKRRANRRPRTIVEAEGKLGLFVQGHEGAGVHELTTRDLVKWLDGCGFSNGTRDSYRRQLVGLFNFSVKHGYRASNPAAAIERSAKDEKLPEIHTSKQVESMLRTAADSEPLTVPYFALGYFAGLRPENELAGLDWSDIDFESRLIRVRPETAKKRRMRYVDMSENLVKWLLPYRKKSGKIGYRRKRCYKVRKAAGVAWAHDVMRHTYGTMHLAHHNDIQKTALQMGHTRPDMLFNHYRNLVKPAEAAAFWGVEPEQGEGVIEFKKAG